MSDVQGKIPKVKFQGEGTVGEPTRTQAEVDEALRRKIALRLTGREDATPEQQLKVVNDLLELRRLVEVARRKLKG